MIFWDEGGGCTRVVAAGLVVVAVHLGATRVLRGREVGAPDGVVVVAAVVVLVVLVVGLRRRFQLHHLAAQGVAVAIAAAAFRLVRLRRQKLGFLVNFFGLLHHFVRVGVPVHGHQRSHLVSEHVLHPCNIEQIGLELIADSSRFNCDAQKIILTKIYECYDKVEAAVNPKGHQKFGTLFDWCPEAVTVSK